MSDYVVPSVQVNEEFTQAPVFSEAPMSALIIGPNYKLTRYAVPTEKPTALVLEASAPATNINKYVGSQRTYNFQSKPVTAVTDPTYLQVYLDNALVTMYQPAAPTAVTIVGGQQNRIESASLIFQSGGAIAGTPQVFTSGIVTAGFGNRGVQIGDTVLVGDSLSSTRTTKVVGFDYTTNAASVTPTMSVTSAATCVQSGTYTGTKTITYRVICTAGGAWGTAKFTVLSNDVESYGPYQPTSKSTSNTFVINGMTFTLSETTTSVGPITGDEWRFACTPVSIAKYSRLVLADNLPLAAADGVGTWASYAIKSISIPATGILVPRVNPYVAGSNNWNPDTTAPANPACVVLNASIQTVIPSVGVLPLNISYAEVYVTRRDLLLDYAGALNNLNDISLVDDKLGVIHPDNPLAKGVYNALLNSNGTTIYFVAVASDDVAGYANALELSKKNSSPYGVVPLTFNTQVQQLVQAHVAATSGLKTATKWRAAWLSYKMASQGVQVDSYQGTIATAPDGGAKTVTLTNPNGIVALQTVVAAGDILQYNFQTAPDGTITYTTAVVTSVPTNNTVVVDKILTGLNIVANVAFKVTIVRNYTSAQKVAAYLAVVGGVNDFRTRAVFPDEYKSGGIVEQGYLLAAGLAGLRAGSVPHQSLTNVQVLGPDDLYRVTNEITEDDLNNLAAEGVWIVTQTAAGSPAYTRDALTTDQSSLSKAKESIVTNADNLCYGLQKALAPFVGIYNINAGSILKVRAAADNEMSYRMTASYTETAGTQLNGYQIKSVAQDTTFKNRVRVKVGATVPAPMDNINVDLEVSV